MSSGKGSGAKGKRLRLRLGATRYITPFFHSNTLTMGGLEIFFHYACGFRIPLPPFMTNPIREIRNRKDERRKKKEKRKKRLL